MPDVQVQDKKYVTIILKIVVEQELLMGPVAVDLAKNTPGIQLKDHTDLNLNGDPKKILHNLIQGYQQVFGRTSIEVSKRAIKSMNVSKDDLPEILK